MIAIAFSVLVLVLFAVLFAANAAMDKLLRMYGESVSDQRLIIGDNFRMREAYTGYPQKKRIAVNW